MLAVRPHEAVGNGSPRWMTAASRKRAHRTRPTGRLTPLIRRRPETCRRAEVRQGTFRAHLLSSLMSLDSTLGRAVTRPRLARTRDERPGPPGTNGGWEAS